ncbi:putative gamma-glutamylcyclotransferase [Tanacetum coccineum]
MLSHEQKHQTLIFSYGTLKRGFANHPLIQSLISQNDAVFIGTYTTDLHFPLVQGPYGVPFLLNFPGSGQHRVRGELYSVSDHGLEKLDDLEGITLGHYERLPVKVVADENGTVVEAMAYYGHRSFADDMWRKCGRVGFGEYSHELEKCYVKRDLRPKDTMFEDMRIEECLDGKPLNRLFEDMRIEECLDDSCSKSDCNSNWMMKDKQESDDGRNKKGNNKSQRTYANIVTKDTKV